jgi:UPF0755 protein
MCSQRKKQSPAILGSCILPLLGLLVLSCSILGVVILSVPAQAEAKFGPAHPGMDSVQRYLLSALLLMNAAELTTPADSSGIPVPFTVELGESPVSVSERLAQQGIIPTSQIFRTYLQYRGLDTTLQAGSYELSPAMTPIEIAHTMQDATPAKITFVVLPGWRIEEIARALPTSGLEFSPKAFLSAAQVQPEGFSFLSGYPSGLPLEGFLAPGMYELPRQTTAPDLIETMLARFSEGLTPELQNGFAGQGLSTLQAVTLASIVQREAVIEDEMPLIASVFLNRLSAGMELAADPSVQYALGYNEAQQTWWTNPLSTADLQIDSPYNTYLYPGLPPTPISNPGLAALQAVAFPEQTAFYYFRAACDGSGRHLFAETYAEHVQNACQP